MRGGEQETTLGKNRTWGPPDGCVTHLVSQTGREDTGMGVGVGRQDQEKQQGCDSEGKEAWVLLLS